MTVSRTLLFILVLLTSLNPLYSFASRGLYFSVSKMTSSQQNTISDYKQGTVVDVQMSKLTQSNAADTSSIDGKAFDFTTSNTAGAGYLSYDILKNALNGKYLTGDITFKVKTSAFDKLQTTYTVGAASGSTAEGLLTLNGANIKIQGTDGTSSLTIDPATSGGTTTYTIDGTTGTTTSSIVASAHTGNSVCILDQATNSEACAPKAYITAKYGSTNSVPVKELFNDIKKGVDELQTTYTKQIRNGVSTLVYELPLNSQYTKYITTKSGIPSAGDYIMLPDLSYYKVTDDDVKNKKHDSTQALYNSETRNVLSTPYTSPNNTVSTTTNGAAVSFGSGSVVKVTNGVVDSIEKYNAKNGTPAANDYVLQNGVYIKVTETDVANKTYDGKSAYTQVTTIPTVTITGSTTTTTKYACTDSTGTLNPGECDVEKTIANVDAGTSTNYSVVTSSTVGATDTTLFYKDSSGVYKSIPTTGIPESNTDKQSYIPNTYQTLAQSGLSSALINSSADKTITTSGNTTFIDGTLDTSATNTFTSIVKSGNVTITTANATDSGIDLYSPLLDQARYVSTPYLAIAQNIRIDPTKIGSNVSVSDFTLLFSQDSSSSPLANNSANAISYIDGDTTYQGVDAISKIAAAYTAASSATAGGNIQSYASVGDVNYTANAIANSFIANGVKCGNTLCGFGVDYTNWTVNTALSQILSTIQNISGTQNILNTVVADSLNSSLAAAKANNLASYQANYVKGSGTDKVDEYGYKLDDSGNKVKDGTYNVTLREKDWSYETQRVKDLVIADVSSKNLSPQFSTQPQMQNFVSALSGQSSGGFEMSVGYKFRMFKSAFYAAPQLDISMFRNNSSIIAGKDQTPTTKDAKTYTYGNLDSSYAGSLVAKFGFENKMNLGVFRTPFSIYGFGGGTSGLTTYRSANSQSFGLKYGFGAEIFVSKKLAIFGEMFWINFLRQNINYSTTNTYAISDTVKSYINSQLGTTVTLDNAQYGSDTKNLSIKYADFNQVIDVNSIKYTTNESFANTSSVQGVKFGLTYYVE